MLKGLKPASLSHSLVSQILGIAHKIETKIPDRLHFFLELCSFSSSSGGWQNSVTCGCDAK